MGCRGTDLSGFGAAAVRASASSWSDSSQHGWRSWPRVAAEMRWPEGEPQDHTPHLLKAELSRGLRSTSTHIRRLIAAADTHHRNTAPAPDHRVSRTTSSLHWDLTKSPVLPHQCTETWPSDNWHPVRDFWEIQTFLANSSAHSVAVIKLGRANAFIG